MMSDEKISETQLRKESEIVAQPLEPESVAEQPQLSPESSEQPQLSPESSEQPQLSPESSEQPQLSPESSEEPLLSTLRILDDPLDAEVELSPPYDICPLSPRGAFLKCCKDTHAHAATAMPTSSDYEIWPMEVQSYECANCVALNRLRHSAYRV